MKNKFIQAVLYPFSFVKKNWLFIYEIAEDQAKPIIDKIHGHKRKNK